MRRSRAALAKEDQWPAKQRWIGRGFFVSPSAIVYLLMINVKISLTSAEVCLPTPEDTIVPRSLLQAKSAMRWLHRDEEKTAKVLPSREVPPPRYEAMRLIHVVEGDAAISFATTWPLLAFTAIFLLVTCILVKHEAVLKRFSDRTDRLTLDNKVPLESSQVGDFCPDLIVPAGCECILIVPSRPKRGEPFDITDNTGSTVLTVTDDASSAGSAFPRRALVAGGIVLATCGRAESSVPSSMLTNIDFELISSKEDVWADLKYEPREGSTEQDRCTIKSKTGRQLLVMGSVRHNALNITDQHGGLLATTEPMSSTGPLGHAPGTIFRLRVAPQADVGLVLCALICLQHLSTQ